MLINVVIVLITFGLMEGIAWFTHKYIMHGFMWRWHHSHHNHHHGVLEKNDLFSVLFSLLATATVVIGMEVASLWFLAPIGIGVTLYGVFYFIFHDVIVHRRIKVGFKAQHPYLKRIIRAHHVHHKVHEKSGAEAFGFLYADKKYRAGNSILQKEKAHPSWNTPSK
ncbi:sterol desaturase family protein [Tellurirhabdus bombi]|uniref:sterol desaturase family protein n=1 Tax=Tellurirhabdus bombi TaxID=2907205 RepID=UPI001F2BE70E|nr:sterol desaturase family protein [Tellurirhabdus bombi]